jgi:hypothetical protein
MNVPQRIDFGIKEKQLIEEGAKVGCYARVGGNPFS